MRCVEQSQLVRPPLTATVGLLVLVLISSAAFVGSQETSQLQRPVWDVQLGTNARASSKITIRNLCKQSHSFTIIPQETPYLSLTAADTAQVPGHSNFEVPVRFQTEGLKAGEYRGNVVVKCNDCREEKTCTQDREILPVHLVVLGEGGPQMIPGAAPATSPQPPITRQEKPKPDKPLATATAGGQGWDEKGAQTDYKDIAYDDNVKPCKKDKCPKVQTSGAGKDLKIYCQRIETCGGEDCPDASCHMLVATVDGKDPGKWGAYQASAGHGVIDSAKSLKDAKSKKEQIEKTAFKPEKGKAYRCTCF